jgi:hypothetical protein
MHYATDAFQHFIATSKTEDRYHFFSSMVIAYCRPFTENRGIGALRCEYPSYPDFPDDEMNQRHHRLWDLRNKFLGHSSIEGTKVWMLAPGATNPTTGEVLTDYGHAVAKREFLDTRYITWLHDVVEALARQLDADVKAVEQEIGRCYLKNGSIQELDTGASPFEWSK